MYFFNNYFCNHEIHGNIFFLMLAPPRGALFILFNSFQLNCIIQCTFHYYRISHPFLFPFLPLEVHSDRQVSHIFRSLASLTIQGVQAFFHQWKSQLVCLKRVVVRCETTWIAPHGYSLFTTC